MAGRAELNCGRSRGYALIFVGLALLSGAARAEADEPDGWRVELGGERAEVGLGGGDLTWWSGRAALGWRRANLGGAQVSVEPQHRESASDVALVAQGYRFLGRWTIAGQAGVTPQADFYYRSALEAEVARKLGRGLVVHTAWRRLDFPTARADLLIPSLTWYTARGDIQTRVFLGHNKTHDTSSRAVLLRGNWQAWRVVRLQAAAAIGQRLFDVTSLTRDPQPGWIVAAGARFSLSSRQWIGVDLRRSHEDPSFDQTSLALSMGRSF
jgi:YaiO family outer membrane protein